MSENSAKTVHYVLTEDSQMKHDTVSN